jgi:hypothetical protein
MVYHSFDEAVDDQLVILKQCCPCWLGGVSTTYYSKIIFDPICSPEGSNLKGNILSYNFF